MVLEVGEVEVKAAKGTFGDAIFSEGFDAVPA